MFFFILCNILRSILAELFLVGVCLNGWRAPGAESAVRMMRMMMNGYLEPAWVETAAHVKTREDGESEGRR